MGMFRGIREERQAEAGSSAVGTPSDRARARTSDFPRPASRSGERTPRAAAARLPGRTSPASSAFFAVEHEGEPAALGEAGERGVERVLAEKTPIRPVFPVAGGVHLVRAEPEVRYRMLRQQGPYERPGVGGQGRADPGHGEAPPPEDAVREDREGGAVHAPAEGHHHRPERLHDRPQRLPPRRRAAGEGFGLPDRGRLGRGLGGRHHAPDWSGAGSAR